MSVALQKRRGLQSWFRDRKQVKISWSRWGEYGDAPLLSQCSLLRNPLPKPTGVLEHYRWRRNQLLALHFSGCFLLTASLRRRRMSTYISLFIVKIPVNYTSEFWELLEATVHYHWALHVTFFSKTLGKAEAWLGILFFLIKWLHNHVTKFSVKYTAPEWM